MCIEKFYKYCLFSEDARFIWHFKEQKVEHKYVMIKGDSEFLVTCIDFMWVYACQVQSWGKFNLKATIWASQ